MRTFAFLLACLLSLAPGANRLFAQASDGNLTGRITDASGSGIPNAKVQLTNMDTGVGQAANTDGEGVYRFGNMPVGRYKIEVSANGFNTKAQQNLAIELNRTATLNIGLEVGQVNTTVEVAEAATTIDTTSARLLTSFTEKQAVQMPITGNGTLGVINLSLLGAGVSSNGGIGYGTGPSVGGQRPTNNNFTVDGVDNNQRSVTGPTMRVSNEAVAEMAMGANQYAPEFGHSSGGQFNLVTKSGTNELHGSAYLYHQNKNLLAVDESFARQGIRQSPRFDQNRFGGTVGGPVIKNKLFYFGNYEQRPLGQASTAAGTLFAPTAEGIRRLDAIAGLSKTNLDQFKKWVPVATIPASNTLTVSGQTIPLGVLSVQAPAYENFRFWMTSADYNISDRDQIRGRYMTQRFDGPDTRANLPQFYTPVINTAHLAGLTHYHTFSAAMTNELRFGYQRRNDAFPVDGFSYPGLDAFPNLGFADLGLEIGPFGSFPQSTRANVYQLANNFSWVRGRSTWKFGYDGRKINSSNFFVQRSRGDYQYQSLERFLQDLSPETGERSVGGYPFIGNLLSHYWYANNDFRLRPNLTLNIGIRYEFVDVPTGSKQQSLNAAASVPGLLEFRAPTAGKKDFAPRVGLAWSPGGSGRTSVRAGFGMNYDQIYQNLGSNSLPPQFFTTVNIDQTRPVIQGFLAQGGIASSAAPAGQTAAQLRGATSSYIPDQVRPYSLQWNLGVQRVLKQDYTIEVRYLGSRGVHLPYQTRINRFAGVVSPERSLPLFTTRPAQAQLDALALTRADLNPPTHPLQAAGFTTNITAFEPVGNSTYHGLANQITRRFSNGWMFMGAYTWSHNIDDSTATLASTVLTPRRPEDFFNRRRERASSALDHRHRASLSWVYESQWMKGKRSWFLKNMAGNWLFSGAYITETGTWGTVRSGQDANLNGDNAGDRTVINPAGDPLVASAVTPLCRSAVLPVNCTPARSPAGVVGYLVSNPQARYIQAHEGVYANGGRNTFRLPAINNFDLAIAKRISISERKSFELRAEGYNAFNHPQFTAGFPSIASLRSRAGTSDTLLLQANSPTFGLADRALQSNARVMQLVARFVF